MSQTTILEKVYAILNGVTGLSNRCWEGEIPSGVNMDGSSAYCVFQLITDVPDYTFDRDLTVAELQVDLFLDKQQGSKSLRDLTELVIPALNRQFLTVAGDPVAHVRLLTRGISRVDGDFRRSTTTFRVESLQ